MHQQGQLAQQRELAKMQADKDENVQWYEREQWKKANETPKTNDTIEDFNWYKGLSDPDKAVYHKMRPVYRQGPDGQFYAVDMGQTAPPDINDFGPPVDQIPGGGGGNVTGGFPR
jgi:hypothetical protein